MVSENKQLVPPTVQVAGGESEIERRGRGNSSHVVAGQHPRLINDKEACKDDG